MIKMESTEKYAQKYATIIFTVTMPLRKNKKIEVC